MIQYATYKATIIKEKNKRKEKRKEMVVAFALTTVKPVSKRWLTITWYQGEKVIEYSVLVSVCQMDK